MNGAILPLPAFMACCLPFDLLPLPVEK